MIRLRRRRHPTGRLLLFVAVALLAVAAWQGALRALDSPYLALRQVQVTGGPASVLGNAGLSQGQPLWRMDLGRARSRLLARDPWYAQATFHRVFPDRLDIRVVRRHPIALWVSGQGVTFGVDRTGMLLPAGKKAAGSRPYLMGMHPGKGAYSRLQGPFERAALALIAAAPANFPAQMSEVAKEDGQLVVYMTDGTKVRLGSRAKIAAKVQVAAAILTKARAKGVKVTQVDVTHPSAPTLDTAP